MKFVPTAQGYPLPQRIARIGERPNTRTFPEVDSLAALLEAFAESVETGKPFPVPAAEMLEVVGAFEAITHSMAEGRPVSVRQR
jgi:predicted dehydrogenase